MQPPTEINVCRIVDHILCTYLRNHFSRIEGISTAAQKHIEIGAKIVIYSALVDDVDSVLNHENSDRMTLSKMRK